MSYPLPDLRREVAFLAYHFHWDRDRVLDLSHAERRLWVSEISTIHDAMEGA